MKHQADNSAGKCAPWLERWLFGARGIILVIIALATVYLGYQAANLEMAASFKKMIPTYHPFIKNFLKHEREMRGLSNVVRIAVENKAGDIFTPEYLDVLRKINDEVFFIPGVDRSWLKSLWTPQTRWTEVTEEGFDGGPVIPDTYDGSPGSLARVRANIMKSGEVGRLVSNDFRSSALLVPLMDINPDTGEKLDYHLLSRQIESLVREKYQTENIRIHITGFAKKVGDLIDGARQVVVFFGITILITLVLLYFYTRCVRATLLAVACAILAVVWQIGLLTTLGFPLDPFSMLIPFLVFAIGVSHGVQMINGIKNEAVQGADKLWSARNAFRLLYIPALCALVTDGIGFAILYVIRIGVLRDMAVGAGIGFPVLILATLVVLPLLMSVVGGSPKSVRTFMDLQQRPSRPIWRFLSRITQPKPAIALILLVALAATGGFYYRKGIKVGDLDKGAPELRPDSRYNLDNAFMNAHFQTSSDVFVVMLETPEERNGDFETLLALDSLQFELNQLPGVQSSHSLADVLKKMVCGYNEGNLRWCSLVSNQQYLDQMVMRVPTWLTNANGTLSQLIIFLDDHKADTLSRVVSVVDRFADAHNCESRRFLMAAGNAGIEAATNIEIEKAQRLMIILVYSVVGLLVFLTFRSWRATVCILIPLALTSLLCEVLMTFLGIGIKVTTLPVISVGVGIGVDYGVYIYSKLQEYLSKGMPLSEAYYQTLNTTGKAVALTGVTLAIGVGTWAFSPIKFQADMGILLCFMFLWNMMGALCLLPALVRWLRPVPGIRKECVAGAPADSLTATNG